MKISYNWLKQFVNINWDAERTGELLTDLGLEIEGITPFTSVPGGLEGVVVGHVLKCSNHPNADKLKLTQVDLGNGEPVQIVCGAPNVAKGQKVPVATVGTTLYNPEGEPWKIKRGKIRGEVSMGMICAEDELGLGQSHDGIMVLDSKLKPGTPASKVFDIENDEVFEIGLTPNRADAMSHWGVARDLRAGLLQNEIQIELITPSTSSFRVDNRMLKIDVEVADDNLAPRYCGLTISGIKVEPSPGWLQNRIKSIGLPPINNIVDITNYVLHELGQPLHAFDAMKIAGNQINVKTLPAGTKFVTLDEVERELHEEDLMICDAEKPMCIAGVFGGIHSGVTESTTSIFLESAYFDPVSIRKTSKRHGLNTDASFRFERGIDPNACEYAMIRAAILITEIAGGEITSDVVDIYRKKIEDHQVVLNFDSTNSLIGEEIPRETIKEILTSLEIKVNNVTESGIGLTIPAYRNDVTREADVIEEILRVYGYNKVGFSEKLNASISETKKVEDHDIQQHVSAQLTALGYNEMLANSLTAPTYCELSNSLKEAHNVAIINPLSQDLSVLRQSMLFGAMEALSYNINRKNKDVKLFEFGTTYHNYPKGREEKKHLTIIVSGSRREDSWTIPNQRSEFFYFKGIITAVLERLGIDGYSEKPIKTDVFNEGLILSLGRSTLVEFGLINKAVRGHFDVEAETLFADFNWDLILQKISTENFNLKPIPKYPAVKRDFALLLDNEVSFGKLREAALQTEKQLLKDVSLFDVYTGKNLPKGKKSYALSFTLQDERKTLTDKQIDKIMVKLKQRFEKDFGATLR
ncbi:MAG: phenylalanine--tRNA ligase subunit beta [Bacteroidia bacterium]|nr:phenylalanine--tRNA ligase subunit beta [Bacteroidia bacterium]NNF30597.1 phenylalanine--tRNA ligase subunit beta [Flavobacteriaceae bacterium]MBT8275316.1 phenylalanine--tRNA ligase subunit beta [Bacteroidia bacterium]NNJ81976.1 phenylalanine--tRNA ligase subunit beta [Flavobacteriaceae bacterium]NNK54795.1 phenylalanine--tRNA ligase subunit beta [Flavobacteriaceae bacterium]